jgi:hypothetical protein
MPTGDRVVFRFPCRFPAAPSIRPRNRVQDIDYEDFPLRGEPRKNFSLSFPERQGRGGGGATLPSFVLSAPLPRPARSGPPTSCLLAAHRVRCRSVAGTIASVLGLGRVDGSDRSPTGRLDGQVLTSCLECAARPKGEVRCGFPNTFCPCCAKTRAKRKSSRTD